MILHVTFSDGSNPWVSLPSDRHTIAKLWWQWSKKCDPQAITQTVFKGDYMVQQAEDKSRLWWLWERGDFFKTNRKYKTLGHALRALEKLGGGNA